MLRRLPRWPLNCWPVFFCLTIILCPAVASAQRRQGRAENVPDPQSFRIEGKILGIQPGIIQWTSDGETPRLLKLDPKQTRRVTVTGTAEPEFLRPGMFIRFTAPIDKKGNVQQPVKVLTIFTPSGDPEQGFTVGVYSEDPTDPNAPYTVAGQLRGERRGTYVLAAGGDVIRFELDEAPEIGVDVNDYSLAMPGDEIRGNAWGYDESQLVADAIDIKLAEPLAPPQARNRARRGPTNRD